jgi:hypothetical protein
MPRVVLALLLGVAAAACAGSQRASDADWSAEPDTKQPKRLREVQALNVQPEAIDKGPTAVLGVRHDLMLSNAPHDVRCSCLSVEFGQPADPMFFWAGGAPQINVDALIVAVGARGIACPGGDPDDRRRRPSISAVEQQGDDIYIEIEDLPEGRPLASGAIIPRPVSKGAIYVVPRRGNAVYGRSLGGRCRVH